MNCTRILDKVYEHEKMPLLMRIQIGLHLLVCSDCAEKIERYELCRDIMRSEFLPPDPDFEDTVMAMIAAGEDELVKTEENAVPGGFSIRGWVIAGLVMLISMVTAFFGLDFNKVALASGMSFLIPIGITIGIILSSYGALFIGSHLKELSERFGL